MSSKVWLKALVLAGPMLLFPVSRSYYVFYVALLVWGTALAGVPGIWQENRAVRYALYAFALPVLLTWLAWVFMGGAQSAWLGKAGNFLLAALLGLGTTRVSRDERIRALACWLIGIAVFSWIADGSLQLLLGHSIDCRGGDFTPCVTEKRPSLYFSGNSKLSYYIGMLALIPAAWLISLRRVAAAVVLLLLAGAVVMAAGSRFGMLAYLVGVAALALVAATRLPRVAKLALFLGGPLLLAVAVAVFYHANPAFHARMDSTFAIFGGADYATANRALSGRLDIWVPALTMVREHWLFGIGPGNLDAAVRPYLQEGNLFAHIKIFHAHQVLIDILAATGVIGLLAFLAFYAWAVREFIRSSAQGIGVAWACQLVFLLMWFPVNSAQGFYSSEMVFLTFYMLGLGFGFRPDAPAQAA